MPLIDEPEITTAAAGIEVENVSSVLPSHEYPTTSGGCRVGAAAVEGADGVGSIFLC